MDTVFQFTINITIDTEEEVEEIFFITYIPVRNALVIPPTTEVNICRSEYNNIHSCLFKLSIHTH